MLVGKEENGGKAIGAAVLATNVLAPGGGDGKHHLPLFSHKKKLEINKFAPEGMEEFISGNTYYTLNLTNAYEEHSACF